MRYTYIETLFCVRHWRVRPRKYYMWSVVYKSCGKLQLQLPQWISACKRH